MAAETEGEGEWAIEEIPSVDALTVKSKEFCAQGQFPEALSAAEEALTLAKLSGRTADEISAMCNLCVVHCSSGAPVQALVTAKEMRTLCHSTKGNEEGEAQAMIQIAHAHLSQHEGKPASRAATAALKLCAKADQGRGGPAELKVASLLVLAEALLLLLVDYHNALVKDAKVLRDIDDSAARALAAVEEALHICENVRENSDSEEENQQNDKIMLYDEAQRTCVTDQRTRAQAFYWFGRVSLVFKGKEQDALRAASQAKMMFGMLQDSAQQAEALLVMAQAYHKMDPTAQWASNAAHDALSIFADARNAEGKDRTFQLFQEMGIAIRVAGGGGGGMVAAAPLKDGGGGGGAAATAESVVEKPKGLDPEEVMSAVTEMAKAAIGLDEELFQDSPLMDSGMDSLTAVSFRNGLQQHLGVKLPSSLMFDYPTMKEVGNRIVELSLEE